MTNSNTPGDGPNDGELGPAERVWWDRLAGKPAEGGDPATIARADAVRKALLDQHQANLAEGDNDAEAEERARQRNLFAARGKGLVSSAEPRGWRKWFGAGGAPASVISWKQLGGIAAMLMLGVFIAYPVMQDEEAVIYGKPGTERGNSPEQLIKDAKPRARAESIATQLRGAGLTVRLFQDKSVFFLEIELPPEEFEAMKDKLTQAGVQPHPGLIWVRVAKP